MVFRPSLYTVQEGFFFCRKYNKYVYFFNFHMQPITFLSITSSDSETIIYKKDITHIALTLLTGA